MTAMLKTSIRSLGELSDPEEQKAKILADLGDLDQYEVLDDDVLVAIYVTPDSMDMRGPDGKIVKFQLTDKKVGESQFQGKAGLIIKKGPTAWKINAMGYQYEGIAPDDGEWVLFYPHDGRELGLKSLDAREHVICRMIKANAIRMRVADPRLVF